MDPLLKQTLDWYLSLATRPGWEAFVIDAARELAAEHPSVFSQLPRLILREMPELSQVRVERSNETRANTFRIPADYFPCREVGKKERK